MLIFFCVYSVCSVNFYKLTSMPLVQIFDKLCQSFGGDVLETLFNSADGLANCSPETLSYWQWRFISDEALAVASSNILLLCS